MYEEGRDDEAEERSSSLPDLDGSERLTADKQEKAQHFTQPPARYTEATLVKAMEERGVGRRRPMRRSSRRSRTASTSSRRTSASGRHRSAVS